MAIEHVAFVSLIGFPYRIFVEFFHCLRQLATVSFAQSKTLVDLNRVGSNRVKEQGYSVVLRLLVEPCDDGVIVLLLLVDFPVYSFFFGGKH